MSDALHVARAHGALLLEAVETPQPKSVRIVEIFGPTIQGEGAMIGRPTVFVRTGGCDYRCSWCDSLHAVLPEHRKTWIATGAVDIVDRVDDLAHGPILITISGGNPAIQPLEHVIAIAHARGHTVALETQGTVAKEWMRELDHMCISPKPPSSGMRTDYAKLEAVLAAAPADVLLKVVVFDDEDFAYARQLHERFPSIPFALSVGNSDPQTSASGDALSAGLLEKTRWLVEKARVANWHAVTILPQLHVLLWGNARGY